jgi:hypothetical protein
VDEEIHGHQIDGVVDCFGLGADAHQSSLPPHKIHETDSTNLTAGSCFRASGVGNDAQHAVTRP